MCRIRSRDFEEVREDNMSSDQHDDPRNKFRQAFKLIGEAASEALREGITRIDRARRGSTDVMTEPMRQAGAQVLRKHGMDKVLLNPDGTPASTKRAELILRDIAAEVYDTMREAAQREDKPRPGETQTGPAPTDAGPQTAPQTGPENETGAAQSQPEAARPKNAGGAEETVPMPGQSF
jgi:hypothetical protein